MSLSYSEGASSVNPDQTATSNVNDSAITNPLVYTSIIQRNSNNKVPCGYTVYRSAVRVHKPSPPLVRDNQLSLRGSISSFSEASKRRLKFVSSNSTVELISQFCCTYHENAPADGKTLKKHLNNFLTCIRQHYPDVRYIWIMEFQTTRHHPHFHLFLSLKVQRDLHRFLAETWNRITNETDSHLKVHMHSKNFIPWSMGNGAYLANKYLHKESQKSVPEHFNNCGRFWGASKGLVKPLFSLTEGDIEKQFDRYLDTKTGEIIDPSQCTKFIYRVLRKHHEATVRFHQKYKFKQLSKVCIKALNKSLVGQKRNSWQPRVKPSIRKFRSQITRSTSSTLPLGGYIFPQIIQYLQNLHPAMPF